MNVREPRPGVSLSASRTSLVAMVTVVIVIATGCGLDTSPAPEPATPPASQAAQPAFSDLPMVTVPPTAAAASPGTTASALPAGSEATPPSASSTPAAAKGIRANRIRIARLGIDLAIIEGDGIDAPIGKAAHFPGSAWPGDGSNVYIYGHARTGMFITLWKARVGDRIELDLVDGTSRTYAVIKVLPKVPWDAVTYLEPTKTEQLTVQTSTSYYPTAPRFVVIAAPTP